MVSLSTLADRIRNTPGLKRDTIAVAIALVAGLAATVYVLGNQHIRLPWQDRQSVAIEFTAAPGVRPEAVQEVRIAGVPVGRITAADPTDSGTAQVTVEFEKEQRIYRNATAILRTKAPLNVMYIELDPGGPPADLLEDGGALPVAQTKRAVQPYEVLDKLDARTRAALTSLIDQTQIGLKDAPTTLPAGLDATTATMKQWEPVINALNERRTNISQLVTSLTTISEAVGHDRQRLTELTTSMDRTLGAVAKRDKQLSESLDTLPGFTEQLSGSMGEVNDLTGQLDPTLKDLDKASDTLPEAVENLDGTVGSVHNFVNGAAPVVDRAGPVVDDLRPFVADANPALADLKPVVGYLPQATKELVPWMDDLAAFTYQTSSSFSLYDANGGMGRANLHVDLTNPTGGLADEGIDQGKKGDTP
ncbi:MlaD family protein [Nocardioides sp. NPDC000445]|uniref:MlaD family protein n=1 Tax=Nocardioides sp. NPDC000445 TaxID=3154257 RepID=UPI0033274546